MSDKLDIARTHFMDSLAAVAETMRNAAQAAESFSSLLKEYSPAHDDHVKGKRKAAFSPEDGDGTKKRKRNTKPKDPNAPKRPASSYILFQNEVRKQLKKDNPDLTNAELLALIAEQWKQMPDEQKETYHQAVREAKVQYSEEKKAYDNRSPEEVEAANAAAAAALALKKANAKPRGPKPAAAATEIKARPPPPPQEASPSSESSEAEDSDDEEPARKPKQPESDTSSDSEEEEEEEPEPAPKKRRGASVQPPASKSKKNSKA